MPLFHVPEHVEVVGPDTKRRAHRAERRRGRAEADREHQPQQAQPSDSCAKTSAKAGNFRTRFRHHFPVIRRPRRAVISPSGPARAPATQCIHLPSARSRYSSRSVASGNFSAAAERLDVSQPAISNIIRTLETQLGVELFERRRGASCVLTREGVAFRDSAQQFVAQCEAIGRGTRTGRQQAATAAGLHRRAPAGRLHTTAAAGVLRGTTRSCR